MSTEEECPRPMLLQVTSAVLWIGLIILLRPENSFISPPNAWFGSMSAFESWTSTLATMLSTHYSIHIIPLLGYALYCGRFEISSILSYITNKFRRHLFRCMFTVILVCVLEITQQTTFYLWLHIHAANVNHIFFHSLIKTAALTDLLVTLLLP
uniref:Uncharacterized protein n=1 Tax=Aureoumbra lagunensis TaxID=44058 RepID=A0A7S3K6J1_9STRA|mmetsp:Transcript_619/g.794  ORF Transcript_619/g.794 Transcript_619/m.794 type:complete len:154 (+) Transcript_619:54-515(+)